MAGDAPPPRGPGEAPGAPAPWRWGYLLALVAGIALVLWVARGALLPFAFGSIVAYLLAPPVAWLERRGVARVLAILVAYAVVGAVLLAVGLYVIPLAVQQGAGLARDLPRIVAEGQVTWDRYLSLFHQAPLPPAIRAAINQVSIRIDRSVAGVLNGTLAAAFGLVPWLVALAFAPVLAFYLLTDLPVIGRRAWELVPLDWRPAVYKLGRDVDRALSGYVRGQLLVALVVGTLAGAWTLALGIRFPVLIGLVAAITDVVPYIGPVAGAIPAVWLALAISPLTAAYTVAGFVLIHQLEGAVISPKVLGEAVGLHPLMVMVAVLVGAELWGVLGMLVAVPVVAALRIVVEHAYRRLTQADLGG
jgi:predicted PurR-regulated permease PerM